MPYFCEIHYLARTPPQAGVEIQEAGRWHREWAGGGTRQTRAVGNQGGETKTSSVPMAFRKTQRRGEEEEERGKGGRPRLGLSDNILGTKWNLFIII